MRARRVEKHGVNLEMQREDAIFFGMFLTHRELTTQFFLRHPGFAFALSRFDCGSN